MNIFTILLLFINYLILVNATDVWKFGEMGSLRIVHSRIFNDAQIYLFNCRYHKESSRVYCDFKDSKYRNQNLLVKIQLWGDKFDDNDVINKLDVTFIDQYGEYAANGCIGVTSLWETIEAGDTYTPCSGIKPSKGEEMILNFHMKNGKTRKLHFNKIYVIKYCRR